MRSVTFKAGDTILKEGEPGSTAYLIRNGVAKVLIDTKGGPRKVAVLESGEVCGEMCLLEPGPRSASVVAVTDVECLETTYDEFISSIKENPEQAARLEAQIRANAAGVAEALMAGPEPRARMSPQRQPAVSDCARRLARRCARTSERGGGQGSRRRPVHPARADCVCIATRAGRRRA